MPWLLNEGQEMMAGSCPECASDWPTFISPPGTVETLCTNCGWSSDYEKLLIEVSEFNTRKNRGIMSTPHERSFGKTSEIDLEASRAMSEPIATRNYEKNEVALTLQPQTVTKWVPALEGVLFGYNEEGRVSTVIVSLDGKDTSTER